MMAVPWTWLWGARILGRLMVWAGAGLVWFAREMGVEEE